MNVDNYVLINYTYNSKSRTTYLKFMEIITVVKTHFKAAEVEELRIDLMMYDVEKMEDQTLE